MSSSSLRASRFVLPLLLAARALAADPTGPDVQPDARMLRYPDVSATQIAFVYADDIWLVPREGGLASPIASPPGPEMFPRFSPDGSKLAFSADYDGNTDVYVVPTAGGEPVARVCRARLLSQSSRRYFCFSFSPYPSPYFGLPVL